MSEGQNNPEIKNPQEVDPDWEGLMKERIDDGLENFDLFHSSLNKDDTPELPVSPLEFNPYTLSDGEDEREFKDLGQHEQKAILDHVFDRVRFNPFLDPVKTYEFESPKNAHWQGKARAEVFKTGRVQEGMFMHKITFPDGTEEYFLANEDYEL